MKGRLPVVNDSAAGVAIGSRFHVVAIPPGRAENVVRTFQAFTADLHCMADWLIESGVTTVAMESTGVYWVPVDEILEERGLHVILANARDAKNVPGRKTDVNDAQMATEAPCVWAIASQFSSRSPDFSFAVLSAPARTASGLLCSAYPAYAEDSQFHEYPITPCR